MNGVRTPALWALAWVAVVAVVASSVWLVISRAGDGVSSAETQLNDTASSADLPSGTPTRTRSPRPTSAPTPTRTPPPPTSTAPEPEPEPDPPAQPVQRTASGSRGTVSVECTGAAARLAGATPRSGSSYEVEDSGPDRVRVDFENDSGRTRIEASCVGGAPSFDVDDD